MRTIKIIVIVLAVLLAIPLVAALFVPNDFRAHGTVTIDKPRHEVFDYVKYVGNQQEFGVWFKMDPQIKVIPAGADGTEGFVLRWESEVVGNGSQTITRIVEYDSILSKLDFGFGEPPQGYFALSEVDPGKTEVTWGIAGTSPYPWNLAGVFMDMNKDFETGLRNLKEVLESGDSNGDSTALIRYYNETYDVLEKSVASLNAAQLSYRPSDSVWSVGDCLEHIVLTEDMLFDMIQGFMGKPANPERRGEIKYSDSDIKFMMQNRSEKYKAMDALVAKGRYEDAVTALTALKQKRSEIHNFITSTPVDEMRNRVQDSPGGAVDVYQYMLFLAAHTARHTLQIKEVKASAGFPK